MSDRTIYTFHERDYNGEVITEGYSNVLRIERSAAGSPGIMVVMEDHESGVRWGEGAVSIPDPQELIDVLTEWVGRSKSGRG